MKRCLVIRYGAIGDVLCLTPVLPYLKQDGYHVTMETYPYTTQAILKNNPNVDKYIWHNHKIPVDKLKEHWAKITQGYDKVVNFTGSIEQQLAIIEGDPLYYDEKGKRYNSINYYEQSFHIAGYTPPSRPLPEVFISDQEDANMRDYRSQFPAFLILWALSGSGLYKAYPHAMELCRAIVEKYPDAGIYLTGDDWCRVLESDKQLDHPRIFKKCKKVKLRTALLMTKYADLVVAPDTGFLHASGCFDTPKIALYGHSMHANIGLHFKNIIPIQSDAFCSPCCRLISMDKYTEMCHVDWKPNFMNDVLGASLCMRKIDKEKVFEAICSVVDGKAQYAN